MIRFHMVALGLEKVSLENETMARNTKPYRSVRKIGSFRCVWIYIYPKQHPSGPQVIPSPMIVKGVTGSASFTSDASSVPKRIPDLLNAPIVIVEYGGTKNTVNVYGNLFVNGKPVVVGVVMKLDKTGSNMITNIRTVHVRGNFAKQIMDESVCTSMRTKKDPQMVP